MVKLIIALDDTDSNDGMCTTYIMTLIIEYLKKNKFEIINFPRLVRLNPSIPYKTRGNAALSVEIDIKNDYTKMKNIIINFVVNLIKEKSMISSINTNPGSVFIEEKQYEMIKYELRDFYLKTLRDIVTIEEAISIINKYNINYFLLKNGRGIIGSLAAAGYILISNEINDYTYELLTYRNPNNFGLKRIFYKETFIEFDKKTYPKTWDTIDYSKKEKLICISHSKDPVLYGIRGIDYKILDSSKKYLKSEHVDKYCIYKTNQSTDDHILIVDSFFDMKELCSYKIKVVVHKKSKTIIGGHVFITVTDKKNIQFTCAAYEKTGNFRKIIQSLIPGDIIEAFGSFKNNTINLEKINIIFLNKEYITTNPICNKCNCKMKSRGLNKGYKCKKCKSITYEKFIFEKSRNINIGYYEVTPSARRHLSKPIIRIINN